MEISDDHLILTMNRKITREAAHNGNRIANQTKQFRFMFQQSNSTRYIMTRAAHIFRT